MGLIKYLYKRRKGNASLAKERLKIIVSHERGTRQGPDYLPRLQHDLLQVISKYVNVDPSRVKVELECSKHGTVLELNVNLPDPVDCK